MDQEIHELARDNMALRRARYSLWRRLLRGAVVGRPVGQFLLFYSAILATALIGEQAILHYGACLLHETCLIPEYPQAFTLSFFKDLGSYLIAGQIGILAIVTVAVGVVTLLSERTDGASFNPDIRLYYVESYAYELATSGVALLLVLTVQLFWPLHIVLDATGMDGSDHWSKLALSALHALWFCLNLMLFLQFITTTLRFVEPNSRETMRERYSANDVIPHDAKMRLMRALYMSAPRQMFGDETLKKGPGIAFGYISVLDNDATEEIATTFRTPTRLVDVYTRPLHWALARWQTRARQQPQRCAQFGEPLWDANLTIEPNFDSVLDGSCSLVRRRGDVALTSLEKWIIRRSLRFTSASSRADDMPTPDNFLEQLVDKLVRQIEQIAATGFRAALDEVVHYHRFILATQNTKDERGNDFNLAEIGDFFSSPNVDWVRQYRRAFFAAADKIGTDTSFIVHLSNLASRLVPKDAVNFSPRVLQTLLELGLHEVVSLEDWVTRRAVIGASTEPGTSPGLTGSDKRAYENALIGFVGGWETLAQTLIFSFSLERRPSAAAPEAQWNAFAKGFPVLQTHLHYSAYFLVAAVWNDDAMGADRFRDLLLRWLQPYYANLRATYLFPNSLLVTPDLVSVDWQTVQSEVASRMRFRQDGALPGPVSGILLWELHCDAVCVSGLIALHWYATNQQPSKTALEAALLTLHRQKREFDGSDLTETRQKSVFRLLLDFAIRYALNSRFVEGRYSVTIDGMISLLTNIASPRMVAGRVYSGVGIDGLGTLRPVLLASMAANLPVSGDDGVAALVEMLKSDNLFAADRRVRDLIWTMQQMVQTLDQAQDDETYAKAAYAFDRELDLPAATARLRAELASIVMAFEALRKERLSDAPLDEGRMDLVRRRMTQEVLTYGPSLTVFHDYKVLLDASDTVATTDIEFGSMDKGLFTVPEMSATTFEDIPRIFADVLRGYLSDFVWRDLYNRPKRVISVDLSEGTEAFWQRVVAEAPSVGPEPMLLVPFALGEEIAMASLKSGELAGLRVTHISNMPSGGGTGYVGSVEEIPVYSAQGLSKQAILCSGRLIVAITYGGVHGGDQVADFSFIEGDDPEKSLIRLKFAQRVEWADDIFVEFQLNGGTGTDSPFDEAGLDS